MTSASARRAAIQHAIDAAGGKVTPAIAAELGELLRDHLECRRLSVELATAFDGLPATLGEFRDG